MATLTVWKFDTPQGAEDAYRVLNYQQGKGLVTIHDAAWVDWAPGKRRPKTHQAHSHKGAAAVGGLWGLLFGLIFFVPVLGVAVGAATGAVHGSLTDLGIDESFIRTVREEVTPGTSALFMLTSDAVIDKLKEHFPGGGHGQLISTNLSPEQEGKFRAAIDQD